MNINEDEEEQDHGDNNDILVGCDGMSEGPSYLKVIFMPVVIKLN